MRKKQLQKILKYDIHSGVFYNRESKKVAGKIDPDGYVYIWIDKNKHRADKLAWLCVYGCWPKHDIIHIDDVNCNNWIDNLRKPCKLKRKDNKSGIPGVSRDKRDKRWRAQIAINSKQMNLGNYKNFDNAVLARFKAEHINDFPSDSPAHRYIQKMFL